MTLDPLQIGVFLFITALIGLITYLKCRGQSRDGDSNREYFLAGGGVSWIFVAGSITLTNLSTDQLVGMNGSQMALVALWELSAVVGLFILAGIFVPIYYKYKCTTTTELLEKRYKDKHIRATISSLFLLGNIFIFLPAVLYTGSLFMQSLLGLSPSPEAIAAAVEATGEKPPLNMSVLMTIALCFALVGAAYTMFGGLRAVVVSDTISGVLLLGLAVLVVYLALNKIDFDFTGIPAERLTLIGDSDSDIPWHTLLTGMLLIQIFYWSTNQVITQRAMASPTVKEAQKGVVAAALIRLLIVPPIIVIPGIVSFKLYGDIGDAAYGRIVGDLLPLWLSGAFAAAIAAAVLTTFNSILNSSVALYVCDIHEKYFDENPNVPKLGGWITVIFIGIAMAIVPFYASSESIIDLIQRLYGLLSMPILSTFIVGLIFKNVNAKAAIIAATLGSIAYGFLIFNPFEFEGLPHYIHLMFINFFFCIAVALFVNKFFFKQKAEFVLGQPLLAEGETV